MKRKVFSMNILAAWRDSLNLLQPKQFKLLCAVVLKGTFDLWVAWGTYFWWLGLFYVACAGPEYSCLLAGSWLGCAVSWKLHYLGIVEVTLLLMARPSVGIKNYQYLRSFLALRYLLPLIAALCSYGLILYVVEGLAAGFFDLLLLCYLSLFILFFFDSAGGSASAVACLRRAGLMLFYDAPLYVLVMSVTWIIRYLSGMAWALLSNSAAKAIAGRVVYVLVIPLFIAVITTLYIKLVHDHFVRYFGEQSKGYHD